MKLEVLVRVREGVMCDQRGYVRKFGGFGAHELAAGRGVEEEVADGDGGPGGQAGVLDAEDFAARDFEVGAGSVVLRARLHLHAGDGGNGGEGLTAKAERGDG